MAFDPETEQYQAHIPICVHLRLNSFFCRKKKQNPR
jgi:hypothetical protein